MQTCESEIPDGSSTYMFLGFPIEKTQVNPYIWLVVSGSLVVEVSGQAGPWIIGTLNREPEEDMGAPGTFPTFFLPLC